MPKALVTGASTGIGRATAQALEAKGFDVLRPTREELDLESFGSIRAFAALQSNLDVVVHNAGAVYPSKRSTVDHQEAQCSVIYLGPFLLTQLLTDALNPQARIINVVSDLHRHIKSFDPEELRCSGRYQFLEVFARCELAKILWTYELSKRRPDWVVHCLHPGGVKTDLFRHMRPPLSWLFALSNLLKRGPEWGCQTSVYLACDPTPAETSGEYWIHCKRVLSSDLSRDAKLAQKLWQWSEEQAVVRQIGFSP